MNYWALHTDENVPGVLMERATLTDAAHRAGISTVAMRRALHGGNGKAPRFQLTDADGAHILEQRPAMPDLLAWSWVPIVSARARHLMLELGSAADDFLPCRFAIAAADSYFLHLPLHAEDIVDVARSSFLLTLPADPPLPFHLQSLALRQPPTSACFRARVPGHAQLFGELFVNDAFRDAWRQQQLRGAAFRLLTPASNELAA